VKIIAIEAENVAASRRAEGRKTDANRLTANMADGLAIPQVGRERLRHRARKCRSNGDCNRGTNRDLDLADR